MARLRPCKTCKTEVSTNASRCPHCGEKNPTVRWYELALGGLVVAAMFFGGFQLITRGHDDATQPEAAASNPPPDQDEATQPNETQAEEAGWREQALEGILAENPTIVEATWTSRLSLWVSRLDDGTRHDGFAEYVCVELMGRGKPDDANVVITIWSHQDMLQEKLTEIGKFVCG